MNRGIPFTAIPLLFAASTLATSATSTPAKPVPRSAVQALAPAELDVALKAGTWLIVEFGGEHCIPCRAMQPILQDLQVALGSKAKIHNFWIQENPEVASRFKIMVMPTQVVFNPQGEEVFRHMGYFPPEEFHATLQKLGLF